MRHRARARRAAQRDEAVRERVGLCVLRIEPRVGGAVYTTYLIEDLAEDARTSTSTAGTLDASLDRIRAFAEALCAHDDADR